MAQVKTVFPEAYTFRQEKDGPPLRRGSFQLTVEPSLASGQRFGLPAPPPTSC